MLELQEHLAQAFRPASAESMDFTIAIASPEHTLTCVLAEGRLSFAAQPPDFTIYVPGEALALALFRGELSPLEAFTRGELRASGYIVDVFRFLRCFLPG